MALPQASDNPTAQLHYAAQTGISTALIVALRKLWRLIDLRDLKSSRERYAVAAAAVYRQYASASAAASLQNYSQLRTEAGITEPYRPRILATLTVDDVRVVVNGATEDLWNAPGVSEGPATDTITKTEDKVEGELQKLVMNHGRNEMIEAIQGDRYARGFARVTKPGACAFCRMLATRGAVYKTASTAGAVGVTLLNPEGLADVNRYHPNCHCTVLPLFAHSYEAPAHTRDDMALWDEVTGDVRGSKQKQKAWRRHVEGRADGPERTGRPESKPRVGRSTKKPLPDLGFDKLTRPELEAQAATLEALPDSDYRTKQLARVRRRLASI
jgi:hypothetical protein